MCATTPIDCPECGELLYLIAGRRTECRNGHVTEFEKIAVPGGHTVSSQYYASGRSLAVLRTSCVRCQTV